MLVGSVLASPTPLQGFCLRVRLTVERGLDTCLQLRMCVCVSFQSCHFLLRVLSKAWRSFLTHSCLPMSNAFLRGSLETFSQACVSSRPVVPCPASGSPPGHVDCALLGAGGAPLRVPRAPPLCFLCSSLSLPCAGLPNAQLSAPSPSLRDPVGLPFKSSFLHGGGLQTVKEKSWAVVGLSLTLPHLPGTCRMAAALTNALFCVFVPFTSVVCFSSCFRQEDKCGPAIPSWLEAMGTFFF